MSIDSTYSRVMDRRIHLDVFDRDEVDNKWSILATPITTGEVVLRFKSELTEDKQYYCTLENLSDLNSDEVEVRESDNARSYNCLLCGGESAVGHFINGMSLQTHRECMKRFINHSLELVENNSDRIVAEEI